MNLFGKKLDPKEQVRKWRSEMRKEMRTLDRQIMEIKREQKNAQTEIKRAAKAGDQASAKILAKEYLRANKAINRMHTSKAQMNSVIMSMEANLAMVRVTGCLAKSAEVMATMNRLVRVSEVSAVMQAMSQEMMKAGLIDEMVSDTMEGLDDEDLDEEADEEVMKVLGEITAGVVGQMASVPVRAGPAAAAEADAESDEDPALADMQARLAALH
eukprot:c12398_g1_i1.p2 GENE.c12398_g1_i1~~c12398_g1_i1.p2  ORF type:complete len:214 (-),score=49.45 c12398_g1_i1:212-853(-)